MHTLVEAGWHIEAEGKVFRRPGQFRMEVSSGVDWFELHGDVEYGETKARLPQLLEALRRGDKMVRLDDGTYGVLPEEWLSRIGMLAGMGTAEDGHIRFRRSQAGANKFDFENLSFKGCDNTIDPTKTTDLIIYDFNCGALKKDYQHVAIPRLSDGGQSYEIFNDKLCSPYNLKPYPYGLKISDFAIENLSRQKFCETYITNP